MSSKTQIIEFHGVDLYCPIVDGKFYVAIRPICQALGIQVAAQMARIKDHLIFGDLYQLVYAVGKDEKQRHMGCLPIEFALGWISTIDLNMVKTESVDTVMAYQIECCKVIGYHFFEHPGHGCYGE